MIHSDGIKNSFNSVESLTSERNFFNNAQNMLIEERNEIKRSIHQAALTRRQLRMK